MDFANMARTARESLARGLSALQSPGVPDALMSAAEPIAEAMGNLHRIESSRGSAVTEAAPAALLAARRALAELQSQEVAHPSVDDALEAVAGSLGLIHHLTQATASQVPAPPTQPSQTPDYGAPPRHSQPDVAVLQPPPQNTWPVERQQPHWDQTLEQQPSFSQGPVIAPPPQPAVIAAPPPQALISAPPQQLAIPAPQPPPWQQPSNPPSQPAWNQPTPASAQPAWSAPPQQHVPPQPAVQHAPQAAWQPNTLPAGQEFTKLLHFDAELGAHSPSNFYKGLSGNDVIDSGGLFVATYQIPDIGRNVHLKVSLPGGYEFEAAGIVRWTREAPQLGAESPPGFGVQFTHITPEGRQLVYRYVRNREPIFHDDL